MSIKLIGYILASGTVTSLIVIIVLYIDTF